MIVPRSRLLFWVAVVGLPFSIIAAVEPPWLFLSLFSLALLLLLALVDAAFAMGSLKGVDAKFPDIVRLSRNRQGAIEVRIQNQQQQPRDLSVGLALPREIESPCRELRVLLPANSEWSLVRWPCKPLTRGQYHLNRIYLEGISRLGFWSVRASVPASLEIRVYPNLLTERKNLAALFLNRGTFGLHSQRQLGKGREFEKLREYVPGDPSDEIHWKATAKRGHPVTKVFQIERTQEVYVVIDAARLSARPASVPNRSALSPEKARPLPRAEGTADVENHTGEAALERFVTAALVLGLAAEQQGDLFGLLTFADKAGVFIRARNGRAHYHACRDALYTLQPQMVTPDFDELATFIRLRLRRRALLIFLTALDDPVLAESFARSMDLLCRQHLVLVNMLKPAGADPLFSQPNAQCTDDLYERLGGHIRWQKLRELQKVLGRRGVQFSLLENENMTAQLISQYIGVKQRQLL